MNIEGISLRLVDTAGIRETEDTVEALGVEKARQYLDKADIVLCVIDGSTELSPEEIDILKSTAGRNTIVLLNKSDVNQVITVADIEAHGTFTAVESISAAQGEGTVVLSKWVKELVYGGQVSGNHDTMISNVRHISLMEDARSQIQQALDSIDSGMPVDFVRQIAESLEAEGAIDLVTWRGSHGCATGGCTPDPDSPLCAGCPLKPIKPRRRTPAQEAQPPRRPGLWHRAIRRD